MTAVSGAGPTKPILLRAPDGADIWTIIELQGSIESKAATLNGAFARLTPTTQRRHELAYDCSRSQVPDVRCVCAFVARPAGVQFAQLSWEPNSVSPPLRMCQHTL